MEMHNLSVGNGLKNKKDASKGTAGYPVSDWHGGKVQHIRDSVIHMMRGQVYEICGKRFFTMGGASSHDIEAGILEPDAQGTLYRVNHISWWKEELPSDAEYETATRNLKHSGWKTDYIITHGAVESELLAE